MLVVAGFELLTGDVKRGDLISLLERHSFEASWAWEKAVSGMMRKRKRLFGLSRLTGLEKAVKNTSIIVIYRVLVYTQMSQPTTCFGLF